MSEHKLMKCSSNVTFQQMLFILIFIHYCSSSHMAQALKVKTRLISIESQPKKIVVVVVVVIVIVFVVVVNVVHVVVVLIAGVDPRNLPLKFGFNQVINR